MSAVLGALVWTAPASAQTPPPPEDVPAVSAYVELVPTSGGSRSPGVGAKGKTKLSPKVKAEFAREGGADAPLLEKLATAREYGAPPAARPKARGSRPGLPPPRPSDETPLAAGVSVVTDGSNGRVLVLGLLLIAMTAGAIGAAVYGRRTA